MSKSFTLYGTSLFLIIAAILLIRNGLKKGDFKSTMSQIHYRPIRNYGQGFSIALGILCLILGVILLTLNPH
jgi:cytochrome c biogenesis protein CcdA